MALLTNINGKFSVSDAGAVTFNDAFTFPTADGTANYVLKTNGSGQLAWAADNYENYDYWILQGDSASNVNINSTNTLKFVGGTYIDTSATWAGGSNARKLTINHETTSRTDTTSTDAPAFGGTFEAVTSVTTNTTGHVTAIDVSTVTIPTDPGGTVKGTGTATEVAFWTANDTISSDDGLYWDNTNKHLGINDNTPGSALKVTSGTSETSVYTVDIHHVRNDANVGTIAQRINMDLSGADTTTADRTNYGLFIDIDSSANGDASNEHRIYGVSSTINFTGFTDIARGGFFNAESNYNGAKTAQLVGVYGQATHDTGNVAGGVSNMYGVYGYSAIQDLGDVDNAFGGYFLVNITDSRGAANVGVTKAVEGEINIDKSTAIDYGTMIGISSIIDNNEGAVPNFGTQYLFKGDYQGTRGGNAYGIYCEGDKHYLEGNVGIGTDSPNFKLDIANAAASTATYMQFRNGTTGTASSDGTVAGIDADGDFLINNQEAKEIKLYTSDTPRLIIQSGGNVGIGVTGPDAKLTVDSTTAPQLLLTNTGGGNSQILMYDNSGGTQNASITFDQTGDNQLYITTGYDSPNDLNRIYLQPGGETAMTLVGGDNTTGKAGNVGIGTDIPSQKLSIATNALTSNPEYIEFQDFGSGSSWAIGMDFGGIQWHTGDGTGIGAHLIAQIKAQNERNGAAAAGALVFSTAPYNTVMSERMRIKSDGNILIADTRKIEFYNTSQYIYANSTNDLTLASGDDINFQSNYIRFFHAGVEGSRISATTASWVANGSNGTLGVNRVPSGSYNLEILGSTYSSGSIRSGSWFQGTSATNTLYSSTALGTYLQSPGNSGTAGTIYFRNGSGTVSANIFSGTITAAGDVIAYGSPSDKRLKENIKPIKSALDKVIKLQGVTFDWKEKGITNLKEDIGFIAQDVQKVIPELVRENEDGMLSMRHQGIAPILLEAIKELKAEIEELKFNKCNCNK